MTQSCINVQQPLLTHKVQLLQIQGVKCNQRSIKETISHVLPDKRPLASHLSMLKITLKRRLCLFNLNLTNMTVRCFIFYSTWGARHQHQIIFLLSHASVVCLQPVTPSFNRECWWWGWGVRQEPVFSMLKDKPKAKICLQILRQLSHVYRWAGTDSPAASTLTSNVSIHLIARLTDPTHGGQNSLELSQVGAANTSTLLSSGDEAERPTGVSAINSFRVTLTCHPTDPTSHIIPATPSVG